MLWPGNAKNEAPFTNTSPESIALAGNINSRNSAPMADNYQPATPTTSEDAGQPITIGTCDTLNSALCL